MPSKGKNPSLEGEVVNLINQRRGGEKKEETEDKNEESEVV